MDFHHHKSMFIGAQVATKVNKNVLSWGVMLHYISPEKKGRKK
jgi:hypothetical protein